MNLSLNEIEVMCKRAARGAGLPWGLAEEAAAASRFLTEVALPGADMLARLLERNDRRPVAMLAPMAAEGCWRAVSGRLCPVIAGSVLSDRAAARGMPGSMPDLRAVLLQAVTICPPRRFSCRQSGIS